MKNIPQTLAFLITFLLSLPVPSFAGPRHTGIQGQAFLYISYGWSEIAPGVWVGPGDIQMPVATTFVVLSSNTGREITRVTTDAGGFFTVSLNPGRYVLAPEVLGMLFNCDVSGEPIEVVVRPRELTVANIFYFRNGPCPVFEAPLTPQ
jgi:hypothetical protein